MARLQLAFFATGSFSCPSSKVLSAATCAGCSMWEAWCIMMPSNHPAITQLPQATAKPASLFPAAMRCEASGMSRKMLTAKRTPEAPALQ